MRRVTRLDLAPDVNERLRRRQAKVNQMHKAGALDVQGEWKSARKTKPVQAVADTLKRMMGARERCMYCLDSHGTDIDHFWPKSPFPERMFVWNNMHLCGAECGRFKGDEFPQQNGQPLLIDPTVEDPWQHLDLDPSTGNVVARFDVGADIWSEKGLKTVELLRLDRREALSEGYKRTLRRLSKIVERALASGAINAVALTQELLEADDHGLVEWCVFGSGKNEAPFCELRTNHAGAWNACSACLRPNANP